MSGDGIKNKLCIVSCSVLKAEILRLVKEEGWDVDVVFVSKFFHVEYDQINVNLRQVLGRVLPVYSRGVVLVYGDLCLGPNGEMKDLADELGVVKVDALNCTDCLFGGKGSSSSVDPNHELMVLNVGMLDFFGRMREKARSEGLGEEVLQGLFSGLRGIVFLDTVGGVERFLGEVEVLGTGLSVVDVKCVGLGGLRRVLVEAFGRVGFGVS